MSAALPDIADIALIAAFGLAAGGLGVLARNANRRARAAAAGGDEAPAIAQGRIIVTGLGSDQTRRILADFAKLYGLDAARFAVADAGGAVQVTWTRPISADTALFLVNYLAYPATHAASGGPSQAVGVIAVPEGIAPRGIAPGTLAKLFVPVDDSKHDLVHALTSDGRAFRISFARMAWQPITDPRAPAFAGQVAFATEG